MGFLKLVPDLSLSVYELKKMISFLDVDGWRRLLLKKLTSQGVVSPIKLQQGQNTVSGDRTLQIVNPILAIDSNGQYVSVDAQVLIPPQTNQWYWLRATHAYSNQEEGIYSIDTLGNLTASGVNLLTMLRGQPDFPSLIKFVGSTINTAEYQVLEVIDATHATLQGNFSSESGLKIALVGTFTPGIVVPEINKYPFNYDSSVLEFIQETSFNVAPVSGSHLWLARIKVGASNVDIQLKHKLYTELRPKDLEISDTIAHIAGIDFSRWQDQNTPCDTNQVQVSWGLTSTSYQLSGSNKIILLNASGGLIKNLSQLLNNSLNGFLVYPANGNPSKILTSTKNGSTIELVVEELSYDNYSIDGGETFINMSLTIVPDVDMVEWKFLGDKDNFKNRTQHFLFQNQSASGVCEVKLIDYPKTNYRLLYRLRKATNYSEWKLIASDPIGYITEFSFNGDGSLKDSSPQLKTFIADPVSGFIELTGFFHSYINIKNNLLKNRDGVENLIFPASVQTINLYPTVNKVIQLITAPGAVGSAFQNIYINLLTTQAVEGSKFIIQLGGNVQVGSRNLKIVTGYTSSQAIGTVLKELTNRDFLEARNVTGGLRIEFIYSGSEWVVSQDYQIGPKGEIVMFSGSLTDYDDCFDGSGLGKANGWIGYAVCNGSNGTPNMVDKFARGTATVDKIGISGGSNELALSLSNIPEHDHKFISHWKKVGKNAGSGEEALYRTVDYDSNVDLDFYDSKTSKVGKLEPDKISLLPSFTYVVYVKRIY